MLPSFKIGVLKIFFFFCFALHSSSLAIELPHPTEQQAWEQIASRFIGQAYHKTNTAGRLIEVGIDKQKANPLRGTFKLELNRAGHVFRVTSNRSDFSNDEYKLFTAFKQLKELLLWHNGEYNLEAEHFPDYDGSGLLYLVDLPKLEHVVLAGGSLHNQGLKAMAQLPHLKKVGIWHIHADNSGFAELAKSKTLQEVRIRANWIEKQNPALLPALLSCQSLKKLTFGATYFKIDPLRQYLKDSSLKIFDLDDAIIDEADYQKLKKEFPHITFKWQGVEGLKALFKQQPWVSRYAKSWIDEDILKQYTP